MEKQLMCWGFLFWGSFVYGHISETNRVARQCGGAFCKETKPTRKIKRMFATTAYPGKTVKTA